jgi:transketolase
MSSAIDRDAAKVDDFSVRGTSGPVGRPYGEALLQAAIRDPRIVAFCADLPGPTETDLIRDRMPERYFEAGIAEANMIGMAAGFARCGDIPFVHSFCVFVSRRCYDQIANQVAYPNLPVKIVGFLPGLTTPLGVSHQAIDDIALMRALPNMMVIEPCGPEQVASAVEAALSVAGPVYLRMKRPDGIGSGVRAGPISPGKGEIIRRGPDGTIVASGLMVAAAVEAADELAKEGKSVSVVNMPSIKPIDRDLLIELATHGDVLVTAENHSIVGGLGSAVAEVIAEEGLSVAMVRIGVGDRFAEAGTTRFLLEKYGLTARDIAEAYRTASLKRRRRLSGGS